MDLSTSSRAINLTGRFVSQALLLSFASVLFLALAVSDLNSYPQIDWDEGWTMTVAQNWVERGFYGRLLNGEFAPPGLEASFPVVSSVALSFRVFGVGIWQGRLAAVVTMLLALALLWFLTYRLFDARIAVASLLILVLLSPHPRANAFWMARQLFAEPLQFLVILIGFAALLLARSRSRLWIIAAILAWGAAFASKAQVLPFLCLALLACIAWNLWNRRYREGFWCGVALVGALVAWRVWFIVLDRLLQGWTMPPTALPELVFVLGFVPTWEIRFTAFVVAVLVGAPVILGLIYYAVQRLSRRALLRLEDRSDDVRVGLWVLAATWMLWFIFMAHAGIARYIFSPIFFGAPFAALMLRDFTGGFSPQATLERLTGFLHTHRLRRRDIAAWIAFLLIIFYLPLTIYISVATANAAEGNDLTETAAYLSSSTSPHARIETYESPLFILLDRPFHYPPDELHVELNKRAARLPATVEYDPLAADPDYLVVGPTGRIWKLYDAVVAGGDFGLLQTFGTYSIYQRVRSK